MLPSTTPCPQWHSKYSADFRRGHPSYFYQILLLLWLHYPRRMIISLVARIHTSLSCATLHQLTITIFLTSFATPSVHPALGLPVGRFWSVTKLIPPNMPAIFPCTFLPLRDLELSCRSNRLYGPSTYFTGNRLLIRPNLRTSLFLGAFYK